MTVSETSIGTALITGGARRIGRSLSVALAAAGYGVAIQTHHSAVAAQSLAREIRAGGGRAEVIAADLEDHDQVVGLVSAAAAALGPVTLLVNNAASFEADAVGELNRARWDRQFAVNLRAPVFLAEAFAAQVPLTADAAIINMLDQRVLKLTPQFLSYTLTKAALHVATTTLAQALAPRVRVNAVAPGPTLQSPRQDAAAFARQSALVPLGHGPSLDEIARAVLYLARSRSITGQTIAVDGGQHVAWKTPEVADMAE